MTTFDSRELRNILGCFATGITVITTTKNGENFGMTVNSFSSVSLNPPLVLWSLDKSGQSFDVFSNAEYYNIHILSEEQEAISNQFASSLDNKFLGMDYEQDNREIPVLEGCSAVLSCRLETTIEQGDHLIIVGRVFDAEKDETANPLIFSKGRYAKLLSSD